MTEQVRIDINGQWHNVEKAYRISYETICELADVPLAREPKVTYVAGPFSAGILDKGELAPLRRGATFRVVPSID